MPTFDRYRRSESKAVYDETYASGQDFATFPRADRRFAAALVEAFDVPRDAPALEVGCGTGHFTSALTDAGLDVLGVDISPVGIRRAAESHADPSFLVADALELPFERRSFGLIVCDGFPVFSEPDLRATTPFLAELCEYLRPDGSLVVVHTSRLSDEMEGTWMQHSMDTFSSFFAETDCEVVAGRATIPHAFVPLGTLGFARPLSELFRRSARLFGLPVRLCYVLEHGDDALGAGGD